MLSTCVGYTSLMKTRLNSFLKLIEQNYDGNNLNVPISSILSKTCNFNELNMYQQQLIDDNINDKVMTCIIHVTRHNCYTQNEEISLWCNFYTKDYGKPLLITDIPTINNNYYKKDNVYGIEYKTIDNGNILNYLDVQLTNNEMNEMRVNMFDGTSNSTNVYNSTNINKIT